MSDDFLGNTVALFASQVTILRSFMDTLTTKTESEKKPDAPQEFHTSLRVMRFLVAGAEFRMLEEVYLEARKIVCAAPQNDAEKYMTGLTRAKVLLEAKLGRRSTEAELDAEITKWNDTLTECPLCHKHYKNKELYRNASFTAYFCVPCGLAGKK